MIRHMVVLFLLSLALQASNGADPPGDGAFSSRAPSLMAPKDADPFVCIRQPAVTAENGADFAAILGNYPKATTLDLGNAYTRSMVVEYVRRQAIRRAWVSPTEQLVLRGVRVFRARTVEPSAPCLYGHCVLWLPRKMAERMPKHRLDLEPGLDDNHPRNRMDDYKLGTIDDFDKTIGAQVDTMTKPKDAEPEEQAVEKDE
jgi:hypothetical protein